MSPDLVNVLMMLFNIAAGGLLAVVLSGQRELRRDVKALGESVARLEGRMQGKPGDRRSGIREDDC